MPTDKEVSCSSSCPQIGHSLGQHTLQSTWVTPSVQEHLQDHHKGPQEGSGCPRSTNSEAAAEAECPAPAPQGATADDAALWDTAQRIVSEAVRRAVAQIMAAGQEPEEQQDLAQHMDLQDENSKEGCQGGDTIQSTWINPSVQEHLQDAPAGPQEGSGLTSTDTQAAAEAERPAPAQDSPTEDDVDLSDIVEYIVSEAVRRAEAEIQGPGQQPLEQQDLAQCTDVPVAAPAPAGLEAIEAHLAGEDERQASTAPLVPAAKEEEENMSFVSDASYFALGFWGPEMEGGSDAGWLPVYQFERRRVDSIVSFVSSPEKEESQKIPFLQNICDLCYNSKRHGPPQGLDLFCQRYGLAENIKMLLEEEPRNKLRTAVRWNAMLAIAELSAVERALEGKEASLLQACFSSVFLLPPEEKMQDMGRYLFLKTMEAMDNMLQALVLGSSASRVSELLQNIFQMLLTFTTSDRECVQERAVGRIEKMSSVLFRHPTLASCARYLRTSERTDIVLVFIEAMRDSSIFDKKRATDLLDMVMEFPDFWLADLPKIMRCIHKNLDGINTAPARQSVASLLLLMADRRPGKVLTTLLRIAPPGDRTALDMWDMMISTPRPLKKILKNLRKRLLVIDSMFPAGVISGSESPDMARKIQSLLPQVVGLLNHSNTEVKRRVLTFFCSVMGHLKSEEARPTVEQLEEKLLPLFDDESSQLRELSICLFRERVQSVMAHDKKRIKSYVHRALLPLFFHLSDQSNNVAKLEQNRSRALEFLSQSLPYLRDAQASLREAAVRFIALRPLETDSKPFVRSLAAQTIVILSSPREQPRSRWALQALCCWCR
ncbi:hypothetical protein Q9966_016516 [Columba livia]|nr:hypothetical protein Q9966_016516 [Columba livia]